MPRQNRATPFGDLIAVPARGALMGNRGILHDDAGRILRRHGHQNWVACALAFKSRQRRIMGPGTYTELFFLDEATALAAGHRPCGECRRERYAEFTGLWLRAHGAPAPGRPLPRAIDRCLHAHRIARTGRKVTHSAPAETLPDGAFFTEGGAAVLVWGGRQLAWAPAGYSPRPAPVSGPVAVLTPQPVIPLLRLGFRPQVHPSAEA